MNFRRIEWIFFMAFLGVNLFLGSILYEARHEQNSFSRSNQKQNIEDRLEAEDIKIPRPLSKEHELGYYLSANQTNMENALKEERLKNKNEKLFEAGTTTSAMEMTHILNETVYISNKNETEKLINAFISQPENVLFGSDYMYLPNISTIGGKEAQIILGQSYEGTPINDSTSRLILSLTEKDNLLTITEYKERHLSNLTPLREKMSLYSEEEAMETLYTNNKLPNNSKILWTQLAYTMILQVRDKNVYIPAWFVAIENSDKVVQIETVNAFTNRIITNNVVQKVESS